MLRKAVESYLAVRRSAGFDLKTEGDLLYSFARFSEVKPKAFVDSPTAIEWAGSAPSLPQRARRLGVVIRLARYIHAEDQRHEIPPTGIFGSETRRRPVPLHLFPYRHPALD
jgi:integrase/recombinase XerD